MVKIDSEEEPVECKYTDVSKTSGIAVDFFNESSGSGKLCDLESEAIAGAFDLVGYW
ncbi:hypothetical protein [Haladaptatus halobius]|uniref:hypothetical protein n=1 Tax=Haladaptatus halobius TaxID=2884875 RepID=UPI001D0A3D55|nr:hypothetical protein [Haladaptatus halobius]